MNNFPNPGIRRRFPPKVPQPFAVNLFNLPRPVKTKEEELICAVGYFVQGGEGNNGIIAVMLPGDVWHISPLLSNPGISGEANFETLASSPVTGSIGFNAVDLNPDLVPSLVYVNRDGAKTVPTLTAPVLTVPDTNINSNQIFDMECDVNGVYWATQQTGGDIGFDSLLYSDDDLISWKRKVLFNGNTDPYFFGGSSHHISCHRTKPYIAVLIEFGPGLSPSREEKLYVSTNGGESFSIGGTFATEFFFDEPSITQDHMQFCWAGIEGDVIVVAWKENSDLFVGGGEPDIERDWVYVSRSTDFGVSWSAPHALYDSGEGPNIDQIFTVSLCPIGDSVFLIATTGGPGESQDLHSAWRSKDKGVTWESIQYPISPTGETRPEGVGGHGSRSMVALENRNRIYVLMDDGTNHNHLFYTKEARTGPVNWIEDTNFPVQHIWEEIERWKGV